MKKVISLLLLLSLLAGGYYWWTGRTVSYGPGVIAPKPPIQDNLSTTNSLKVNDYEIYPQARYSIDRVRVLKVKSYKGSSLGGEISPYDFVLGWQFMSDESIYQQISISQSNRWYHWKYTNTNLPITDRQIETQSANTHLIPANQEVLSVLDSVKEGSLIHLEGMLVNVKKPDSSVWKTSLTREDTGNGSCEIIWVEEATILTP